MYGILRVAKLITAHFSISTSMESRKFRDESGRMYQATNGKPRIEPGQAADVLDEYSVRPPQLDI
jgi:hypothetical protein